MNEYLHLSRRQVFHLLGFNLTLVDSLQYRVDECLGSLREWYLADDESLVVEFFYLRTYFQRAASLTSVVFRYVNRAAGRKVGI